MRRAYKFRLLTNRSQEQALDTMLEQHRRLYNLALRERRDVYEAEERSVSYGEQSGRFKESRKVLPSFSALNFSSAQATLCRLDKAFKAFFRRCKSGDAPGYPRYKPEGRFRTVEFPSYGDGCRLKDNGRLYLQHVGHIKVKLHRPIEGLPQRRAGRYRGGWPGANLFGFGGGRTLVVGVVVRRFDAHGFVRALG